MACQGDFRRRPNWQAKRHQHSEKANEADHETNTVSKDPAREHLANKLFECVQYKYTSPATPLIGSHC